MRGVAAYAPSAGRSRAEVGIPEAVALLSVPLIKTDRFPADAPAALFTTQALGDGHLYSRLRRYLAAGHRALLTSRLAAKLGRLPSRYADRVFVLNTERGPAGVLALAQTTVDHMRAFILFPLGLRVQAPPRVALSLFGRQAIQVKNGNNFAAGIRVTFLRPAWPEIAEIRTANGDVRVRVEYNEARVQLAPGSAQMLRLVPQSGG
jgi:hypothetical protein